MLLSFVYIICYSPMLTPRDCNLPKSIRLADTCMYMQGNDMVDFNLGDPNQEVAFKNLPDDNYRVLS